MDEMTCGKGLAENSTLPASLSQLMTSIGAVLEHHTTALNPSAADSKPEYEAYRDLVTQHADVAARLTALSTQMAGYATLPMAAHDESAMANAKAVQVFETLVLREKELLTLLQQRLAIHEPMLQMMKSL